MKNTIITILAVLVIALGGYVVYDKFLANEKKDTVQNEQKDSGVEQKECTNQVVETKTINRATFDVNKCKNCDKSDTYTISYVDYDNLYLSLENSRKVHVGLSPDSWGLENIPENYDVTNFDNDVVDIYAYTNGQSVGGLVILYLMDDGTVEYTPVYNALKNQTFKSYGKLEGLDDIVKFYGIGITHYESNGYTGHHSTLAQTSDGTYYDVYEFLEKTGNLH